MILLKQNSITCHINLMRSIWILLVCLYLICKLIWFYGCLYKSCRYKEWSLRLVSCLYLFTFYPFLPVLLLPHPFPLPLLSGSHYAILSMCFGLFIVCFFLFHTWVKSCGVCLSPSQSANYFWKWMLYFMTFIK